MNDAPAGAASRYLRRPGRGVGQAVAAIRPVRGILAFIRPDVLVDAAPAPRRSLDWMFGLLLYEAVIVWVMRGAADVSPWREYLFWGGLPLMFLPLAARAAWPGVANGERLFHLTVLAESTFVLKVLFWPANFAQFDEALHWVTASDILDSHRLFLPNSMLPVSPVFPGLEILTTALVNLSGLSLFAAATLIVAAIRGMFIAGLFGFYGRISGSYRLAAIGCLAYMGNSGYCLFDSQFAYETLAVGFFATILLAHAELSADDVDARRTMLVLGLLTAAIVLTHHVTAIEGLSLLAGLAVLKLLGKQARWRLDMAVAGLGVGVLVVWLVLIGNPLAGYLGPLLNEGSAQLLAMLKGSIAGHHGGGGTARQAFVANDGTRTPVWMQVWMIAALPLTALLLANGFFTALTHARGAAGTKRHGVWHEFAELLQLRWRRSWMLLIAMLALIWPVSILLRLTPSAAGWQIGNRLSGLAFVGVGIVLGCSIMRWWRRPQQWVACGVASLALTVIFTGGVVAGWGLPATHFGYKVEGDGMSLEPMAIEAAAWTKSWLGIGNRFASDRDSDGLLGTYGRQDIVTPDFDGEDPGQLFMQPMMTPQDSEIIQSDRLDYLMTDLRLSTARPYVGPYFGEMDDSQSLDPRGLTKWDDAPGVSRIFDDGWIAILDVRGMRDAP
jgi:hypothetical protein